MNTFSLVTFYCQVHCFVSFSFSISLANDPSISYMDDVERQGLVQKHDYVTLNPQDCLTIIYTSGSTGFPKGGMITEESYRNNFQFFCVSHLNEWIVLSYRPLAWASDRLGVAQCFLKGGRTGFSTHNSCRLMEELALVRPVYFSGTPAIWNKIYSEYKVALCLNTASIAADQIPAEEKRLLDVFSKLIPNRCKRLMIGGAMVSPLILSFMKQCFRHCAVIESYGVTECGSIAYCNTIDENVKYRLESVAYLGYTTDDQPFPRGELLVKTNQMFSGYINNGEETSAAFTDDAFFRTGDIVELRTSPGNVQSRVHVIDRKKNFFKLSQGQFVSPELLQNIYVQSAFIEQIYIHGDLMADAVSAVVVPNLEHAQAFAQEHRLTVSDLSNGHGAFHDRLLADLRQIADKESLRAHEIPSRLVIDLCPFTADNGLLTSSMKPCRYKLAAHYADRLRPADSIEQQLQSILESTRGRRLAPDERDTPLIGTGTDSLAAVRLSRQIEHDLGIALPLSALFDPTMTWRRLVSLVQNPAAHISSSTTTVRARMLADAHLDATFDVKARRATADNDPSMIFVTGATGFIGAFLLAELLSVHSCDCRFICLVRCDSSSTPLHRIEQTMRFHRIWNETYRTRLIGIRGDLSTTCFGLDTDTFAALANRIDLIFHCAARVNFVLPYSELYGANVSGTREVIRLAVSHSSTSTPVHYMSTLSVLPLGVTDEITIDQIPSETLNNAYAQSKWVAEQLIDQASRRGLPTVIYRLGLITADSRTGACNQHDLYTLLFAAMIDMGCCPTRSTVTGDLLVLPVDTTVKAIVQLSRTSPTSHGHVYHVVDIDSQLTLDDLIDGLARCHILLKRVDLDQWRTNVTQLCTTKQRYECAREFLLDASQLQHRSIVSNDKFRTSLSTFEMPTMDNDYVVRWCKFIRDDIVH
jgi:fatty acid CoA ligase FadD9